MKILKVKKNIKNNYKSCMISENFNVRLSIDKTFTWTTEYNLLIWGFLMGISILP